MGFLQGFKNFRKAVKEDAIYAPLEATGDAKPAKVKEAETDEAATEEAKAEAVSDEEMDQMLRDSYERGEEPAEPTPEDESPKENTEAEEPKSEEPKTPKSKAKKPKAEEPAQETDDAEPDEAALLIEEQAELNRLQAEIDHRQAKLKQKLDAAQATETATPGEPGLYEQVIPTAERISQKGGNNMADVSSFDVTAQISEAAQQMFSKGIDPKNREALFAETCKVADAVNGFGSRIQSLKAKTVALYFDIEATEFKAADGITLEKATEQLDAYNAANKKFGVQISLERMFVAKEFYTDAAGKPTEISEDS